MNLPIAPFWDFSLPPDEFFSRVSFAFMLKPWPRRMYVKFKEPYFTMDCWEIRCDLDHGLYVNDGDMRFNDFMGEWITDSGADIEAFIRAWIKTLPTNF